MKNCLAIIYCFIYGYGFHAQNSDKFFVEPLVFYKIHAPSHKGLDVPLELRYLRITPVKFIYADELPLSFGFNLGYYFKNEDKLQGGVLYDECKLGFIAEGVTLIEGSANQYAVKRHLVIGNTKIIQINFVFKRNLKFFNIQKSKTSKFIKTNLNFGLNYSYQSSSSMNKKQHFALTFDAPNDIHYKLTGNLVTYYKSYRACVGFDITFGKAAREWFSLNVSVIYKPEDFFNVRSNFQTTIEMKQGSKTESFITRVYGGGNGFCFSISRRIFPFHRHVANEKPEN